MENAENLTPPQPPQTNTEVTTETTPAPPEDLVADDTVERFLLSQGQPQPDTEVARDRAGPAGGARGTLPPP